jgi:Flp pilus assembly protein TadD
VLNPGKTLSDYQPGTNLEDTLAIYVAKQSSPGVKAVSQEEQLAKSRCALESQGKLWCGSCHNPHVPAKDRAAEIKAVCTACHPLLSAAKHTAVAECTSCHMAKRSPADIMHAALTDHRIAKPAEQSIASTLVAEDLRAWHEPVSSLQQRDLALAYLEAAKNNSPAQLAAIGARLLNALPPAQQESDAALSAALGSMKWREGHVSEALALLRRARELEPASGEYAMNLGLVLKQNADLAGAERELKDAIQLGPSLQRAYLELAELYRKEGKSSEAKEVLRQYLDLNPQSILVQLTERTLVSDRPATPARRLGDFLVVLTKHRLAARLVSSGRN